MSSWIASGMQGANPPAGQFNRRDGPGPTLPDAKRIRVGYGPAGRFNDRNTGNDGPLGPLLSSGREPGNLTDADRLQSTQTSKVLAVNTSNAAFAMITIEAARDNKDVPEDVLSAPWI